MTSGALGTVPVGRVPRALPERAVVPASIRRSPLLARGGLDVFEGFPDAGALLALQREAAHLRATAAAQDGATRDYDEVKGGTPARRLLSAPGGAAQDAFYHAAHTLHTLQAVTGVGVRPSGTRGTYSYYARPGDSLSLHRDIDACNLAVITCLSDTTAGGDAGCLCLWPGRSREPLSDIARAPDAGRFRLRLAPGQTLVFFGGLVPHAVLPVGPGEERVVSVLCYRA